ncbi:MAG: TIGR00282 family metallophosphoesterase [candidate division WOR-3 bacterium]
MPVSRILLLGDICGQPGRQAIQLCLPGLRQRLDVHFVIANGENAAAGYGITPRLADELFASGVDCITTGDHAFDRKESWSFYGTEARILRPLNLPAEAPGRGNAVYETPAGPIGVINLLGRVFMKPVDCPFHRVLEVLEELKAVTPVVIIDFHAEATAEKEALGWHLAGKVSAVIGTHTHVQTADEQILADSTAYITDAGMCGAFDSVLGMKKELSLRRIIEAVPVRLAVANGDVRINGVLVEVDAATGRALTITRIQEPVVVNGAAESTEPE